MPGMTAGEVRRNDGGSLIDQSLLIAVLAVLALGIVMVGSASITIADRHLGDPFYYLFRQILFAGAGLALAFVAFNISLDWWERLGPMLLIAGLVLLVALLLPGIGRTVNGSTRWLPLGSFGLQVSEFAKVAVVIYLAGYLVRRGDVVRSTVGGFLRPMVVVALFCALLLAEPDFGAAGVLLVTALSMMFLGGVRLRLFGVLVLGAVALLALLAVTSPERLERLTTFTNPWADPFNSGFQLTQALIAFGRGELLGVGLGGSIQKLFYLPEAHTDFLLAVLAEELGLLGLVTVVLLFGFIVWRCFEIGRLAASAGLEFGAYLAFGVGCLFALQAFINMGVNMGILPTKGLTLPLMSYGGSSIMASCFAFALLFRVDYERRCLAPLREELP